MKDIEYIVTGLYLSLILCILESIYCVFYVGKKLDINDEIVILLFLVNIIGCVIAVRLLKIESITYIANKYF